VAAQWLAGQLPDVALRAIEAHDYRTGVHAETLLADILRLADAAALIDQLCGRDLFLRLGDTDSEARLRPHLARRTYLLDMLQGYAEKHALPLTRIVDIVAGAPRQ
jgi:hypothetical protein